MSKKDVSIGDAVEYRLVTMYRIEGEVKDTTETHWLPATVISVDQFAVGMQDADNVRRVLPIASPEWRVA